MTTYTDSFTGSIIDSQQNSYAALTLASNTQLVWSAYLPPNPPVGVSYYTAARVMDVNVTAVGATLLLPQGNLGAAGADILITNRSTANNPLLVTDSQGGQSLSIPVGYSVYFVLTSNTTVAGVWRTTTFGAGTSTVDANALAGFGIVSLYGKLNETINVTQFATSNYATFDTDRAKAFVWAGGAGTFTLPAASTLTQGWFIWLRNNGSGDLVVNTTGTSLLNGFTSVTFGINSSSAIVLDKNSNNFFALGTVSTQNFSFSSAVYDTSSILTNNYSLVNGAPIIQKYVDLSLTRTANLLVTLPAIAGLYALINATNTNTYQLQFQVSGSAQAPTTVATGTQTFISTDGANIYVLSTNSVGSLQLNDGSVSAPALYYTSEVNTGLYKASPYNFGITVGGNRSLTINAADPTNIQLQTSGTGIFGRIDGGLI